MKELKDKGFFIMADGTKSTDHEVSGKKKKAERSDKKEKNKKRSSAVNKSVVEKSTGRKKSVTKGGKTKKSEDDLDIHSDSAVEDSD